MKRIIFIALMLTACCNNPQNMETSNQIFPKGEVIDNDYFSGTAWLQMLVTDKENFDTTDALRKSVWLAITEIEKRWTVPVRSRGIVMNPFIAIFENRIGIEANLNPDPITVYTETVKLSVSSEIFNNFT